MAGYDTYSTVLSKRYPSEEMKTIFSERNRISTWRTLWYNLAAAEKELGIKSITDSALEALKANIKITDKAFDVAKEEERIRRHDVMAHVHAYGIDAGKEAAGIIHLGATSCYVTDGAELILMRDALDLLIPKLAKVISNIQQTGLAWKDVPCLGYTHYQAAQLITQGKRLAQWAQDLVSDLENLERARADLKFRGAQGTTGTQASFVELFEGDTAKIDRLNELLCEKLGFPQCYDISTQTYSRKVDLNVANAVCGIGSTVQRITGDIRHLANLKEMEEPFESTQIGSSAMAYKRNPMRSERIASLGRKLMSLPINFANTYASQWFERTLDDSAIRRMDIPEMFLLADSILNTMDNVTNGLVIYPARIHAHVMSELPFMASENIIMKLSTHGVSRQDAHEEVRVLSHQASDVVKQQGGQNDLIERMKRTEFFKPVWNEIDDMLKPELFTGRSAEIVERYFGPEGPVAQKLAPYKEYIAKTKPVQLSV
ncbi:hypothetical protein VD0002_g2727 [Verticillium dahliae]|uniref:Adenylosuccinate lyase n=1 Tax=Verticillium dahliae TaxID=27337 RepID=A0AA44WLV3_VERDA|nr:Phosphatidylinositol N-acetylglucosaminyltransferase GPI2 subunit [Verticillium dahliae VDG2]KAH6700918.1 adenylosuccinate lyase [Verticillium dahliae]PNH33854.1 hypothetical protein BJF96_g2823 [Verticillium dahliae]PNH66695.1 hypothetical protein VD0002_g2727 [Verticillium dahliae]